MRSCASCFEQDYESSSGTIESVPVQYSNKSTPILASKSERITKERKMEDNFVVEELSHRGLATTHYFTAILQTISALAWEPLQIVSPGVLVPQSTAWPSGRH